MNYFALLLKEVAILFAVAVVVMIIALALLGILLTA